MRKTPLWMRWTGGVLLSLLMAAGLIHPMLSRGECAALIALSNMDKPYVFGAEGPDAYDCSGLVKDACACFDVELVHSAKYIAYDTSYRQIDDVADLRPGDLVFFDTVRDSDPYDHVGIWLGMNRFVHASSSEMTVMVSELDEKWRGCYSGARRVLESCSLPQLNTLFNLLTAEKASASQK